MALVFCGFSVICRISLCIAPPSHRFGHCGVSGRPFIVSECHALWRTTPRAKRHSTCRMATKWILRVCAFESAIGTHETRSRSALNWTLVLGGRPPHYLAVSRGDHHTNVFRPGCFSTSVWHQIWLRCCARESANGNDKAFEFLTPTMSLAHSAPLITHTLHPGRRSDTSRDASRYLFH